MPVRLCVRRFGCAMKTEDIQLVSHSLSISLHLPSVSKALLGGGVCGGGACHNRDLGTQSSLN